MTFKHEQQSPSSIWVVIADRSRCRILSSDGPGLDEWQEVADLVHAEGRLKPSEVHTDRQGTLGESAGRHHVGEPRTDFKHQTAEEFATEIVQSLEHGRLHNRFGKLVLICPPLFLGVLRECLSSPLAHLVTMEFDKDFTNASIKEVSTYLRKKLASEIKS
jgi:protein required for attachment to host cells